MNIKEIAQALKLKMQDPDDGRFDIVEFAEALIAEVQKQNKPVAYRWQEKGRWLSWYVDWTWHDKANELGLPIEYAYTFPPSLEAEREKQPWPNHNWCVGCSPDSCSGCGTEPVERRKNSEAEREKVAEACALLMNSFYPNSGLVRRIRAGEWKGYVK